MSKFLISLLAVSFIAAMLSCGSHISGSYFTLSEIEVLIQGCQNSDDIMAVFGEADGSYEGSSYTTWKYYAPVDLDVHDGLGGFSVRFDNKGNIIRWDPIRTTRTKGIR